MVLKGSNTATLSYLALGALVVLSQPLQVTLMGHLLFDGLTGCLVVCGPNLVLQHGLTEGDGRAPIVIWCWWLLGVFDSPASPSAPPEACWGFFLGRMVMAAG
ncbi:hypothetical protein E2C01_000534 [Portunus trituberculatus]|uniref:Uncharacterized protein n=1 Tax=Portunus trituberculatus TaxID=210409 RepID=A0A5B7CHP9_PORTR|nr:hypothetical protein [Portunus trituberculatus]